MLTKSNLYTTWSNMEMFLLHKKSIRIPFSADFTIDQFCIRNINKGENIIIKPLDSFSSEAVRPFKSQSKKSNKINAKTFLQQSAICNDTDVTDNDDHIDKSINKLMILFPLIYH